MSGREASELLILKAELKNYKRWYFDCVKQLEQVKRERDAAMKFIPKDCETCAYWRPKEENICVAPEGAPCHWSKREAWKWCGALMKEE